MQRVAVWVFRRAGEILRYETRYDVMSGEYAIVHEGGPKGSATLERFYGRTAFERRLREVETSLIADGWEQIGGPMVNGDVDGER